MEDKNPYVGLAAVLGAFFVGATALIVIFASDYAWILIFIALAFAGLGTILGHFISKAAAPAKKR